MTTTTEVQWVPFEQEKPSPAFADYLTISASGRQRVLRWDGYVWLEKVTPPEGNPWHRRVYEPVLFWRWVQ